MTEDRLPHLDVAFVRGQFPAFEDPDLTGWAFLENAGGSYPARQVIDRLSGFYTRTKVQPYYDNPISRRAGAAMDLAYEHLAAHLNVAAEEVHLGPSTSQNTYVLAHAMRPLWRAGDEIVVTNQDHEANSGAWRRLAETGVVVREWRVHPVSGQLDPADLDGLVGPRTRLVAWPHCSNVVGHWNPVAAIVDRARAVGAATVVDGVAAAPHGLPDVAALGADVYLFSLYKTWGPHLGLMTVRRALLDRLTNQSHYFHARNARKMLLPAGPDHAQIAAAAGVTDYLAAVHAHHFGDAADPPEQGRRLRELFGARERALMAPLLAWLGERDDVRLLGPVNPEERAPTIAFVPLRRDARQVFAALTAHRLMLGMGHFYAPRLLDATGIPLEPGVLRLSFLHYTTEAEIQQALTALQAALG